MCIEESPTVRASTVMLTNTSFECLGSSFMQPCKTDVAMIAIMINFFTIN